MKRDFPHNLIIMEQDPTRDLCTKNRFGENLRKYGGGSVKVVQQGGGGLDV